MKYYEFISEHEIRPAPYGGVYQNTLYDKYPEAILKAMGYLELQDVPMPETDPGVNMHWESSYNVSNGKIITVWTAVADTPAEICSRLRYWFDTEYREANEKLTRFAAMGISEVVHDEIRGKEYHNLMELYTEAEVVRAEINELENE